MQQRFIQIGNSKGIIVSQEIIRRLGFDTTRHVYVQPDEQAGVIIISKKEKVTKKSPTPARLLAILDTVNKEYGPALKKLANL